MRQVLHILKKDVRYLRYEIGVLSALAAIYAWVNTLTIQDNSVLSKGAMELLLPLLGIYLIVRVIQSEPLPGDKQFWITRPYRWTNLFASKVLFILAFVNLPVLVAQCAIPLAMGFPPASWVSNVLWSQAWMMVLAELPLVALAALTTGISQFILAAFSIACALLIPSLGILPPEEGAIVGMVPIALWLFFLARRSEISLRPGRGPWILSLLALMTVMLISPAMLGVASVFSIPILYAQYSGRRTDFSRMLGLLVVAFLSVSVQAIPPLVPFMSPAFSLPHPLTVLRQPGIALEIGVDPESKLVFRDSYRTDIPLRVTGVPQGLNAQISRPEVWIQGADWGDEWILWEFAWLQNDTPYMIQMTPMPRSRKNPSGIVNLRVSVAITLSRTRSRKLRLGETPVNVFDNVQCYVAGLNQHVYCRTPSSSALVSVNDRRLVPVSDLWSPINPILEFHWGWKPYPEETTISAEEEVEQFQREVRLTGIKLTDTPGN